MFDKRYLFLTVTGIVLSLKRAECDEETLNESLFFLFCPRLTIGSLLVEHRDLIVHHLGVNGMDMLQRVLEKAEKESRFECMTSYTEDAYREFNKLITANNYPAVDEPSGNFEHRVLVDLVEEADLELTLIY